MKLSEYQDKLNFLYGEAVKNKDFRLAFELLEKAREYGVDVGEIIAAKEAEDV